MSFESVKARHRLAWGLDVDNYVRYTASEIGPVAERVVEIADPAWNASVLDLGCGPGTASFPAARRVGPGGRVLGIDLAAPMIAHAERTAQTLQLTNAKFVVGDAEELGEIPDASFDCALSNFGVIFAPRPERLVEEVARVLKPGGTFTFSVWVPVGMVKDTYALLASISGPPVEGAATSESWGEPGAAETRLAPHFDSIETTPLEVACNYSSVDEAWHRMRDGRPPFALAYGRMPIDQKQEIEARARDLFRAYSGEDGRVSYERQAAILKGVRRG